MNKKELIEKFNSLLADIKKTGDVDDARTSLAMFRKAISLLADADLRAASEFVECYEGSLHYNNFLTENEAAEIVNRFENQDGTRGPKWHSASEVFRLLTENFNAKSDCQPHYNKWALYVTMNMMASDQHSFMMKWVGTDTAKYFEACHDLAVAKLTDKDRPCWIRRYFGLCEE